MAAALVCALMLAACGGGGSADPIGGGSEQPAGSGGKTDGGGSSGAGGSGTGGDGGGNTPAPKPVIGADTFYFAPTEAYADVDTLQSATRGDLFAQWNPNDPKTSLKPGMKVLFFGAADGCPNAHNGPLKPLTNGRLSRAAALTKIAAGKVPSALRWTPSGKASGCDDDAKARDGASAVYLNAAADGGVGMLTTSGTQSDGRVSFFGPYDAAGQDGNGVNAHIAGSFVSFRQPWWVSDALQPWTGSAKARVRSQQAMGEARVDAAGGQTAQVKQQMMATFLNRTCISELSSAGKPCQIQYLFNTAIVRSGVSDWSAVSWFQDGGVWFDPAQGGIPIVDGPIKPAGSVVRDGGTQRELFTSQGDETEHKAFASRTFDVTVSFPQLLNAVRITAAKAKKVDVSKVTDADLAAMWGSEWNDRSAWVLLTAEVGQEIYNADRARRVEIAGGFRDLLVGPQ